MLSPNLVLGVALGFVALLFAVAFAGDRQARNGHPGWLQSPLVYTLSISVYCTSWTFYGAVGSAARSGLEFATIYLGPTLVFVGWWLLLRKLVHLGQLHGITSIADMVSSRYGKSAPIAALVTLLAVIGATPYIALQLKAVTTSFAVISAAQPLAGPPAAGPDFRMGFWIAVGLAVFSILFGTRNIDAREQHHGVVAAIALEAVVKLVALLAVGVLVVWGVADGVADVFARAQPGMLHSDEVFGPRWITLTFLSAAAIVCLPREFQVTVVEASDEDHLRTASWLFPLYLLLITLFVLPIAIAGLAFLPAGANPDMFVLTLPLHAGQDGVALLAFLGGFSSATSMVIVTCIALSTMISNHLVLPLAMRLHWVSESRSGEIRHFLLHSRRLSICLLLLLGFLYFRIGGAGDALASIGLISFAGVAQLVPALVGGLYWRHANAGGALAGLAVGAALWAYTLFLPSFDGEFLVTAEVMREGLFGLAALRPQALFGFEGLDPLVHAMFWSLGGNTLAFVAVSLAREQQPIERLQSTLFVDVFRTPATAVSGFVQRSATVQQLSVLAQRILGANEAREFFRQTARAQGLAGDTPVADDAFITRLERELAASVGAASARALISGAVTMETISLDELMKIADETQRMRAYSQQLEEKSRQLEASALSLAEANERLTRLDSQKDEFLSQVSHELRTPMTSIRGFSEVLRDTPDLDPAAAQRYLGIIHEESARLTRLLDSMLDLSLLERGEAPVALSRVDPEAALQAALHTCQSLALAAGVQVQAGPRIAGVAVRADPDRLAQVFINLLSNAIKYNTAAEPWIQVASRLDGERYEVRVQDNGPGIRPEERERVFSKFMRGWSHVQTGHKGAGLGLTISRQIMLRLGGSLTLEWHPGPGACFCVTLPLAPDDHGA